MNAPHMKTAPCARLRIRCMPKTRVRPSENSAYTAPTTKPFKSCWASIAPPSSSSSRAAGRETARLFHQFLLAVHDLQHDQAEVRHAILIVREFSRAQGSLDIVQLGKGIAHLGAFGARTRVMDRVGEQHHAGIGPGGVLIRVLVVA